MIVAPVSFGVFVFYFGGFLLDGPSSTRAEAGAGASPARVIVSVMSLLAAPNVDSPANIDAGVEFREDPKSFRRKARQCAEKSLEEM